LIEFFFLVSLLSQTAPFSFVSESIFMNLDSNAVHIRGVYRFQNLTEEKVGARLFYPFPLEDSDYPHEIKVEGADFRKGEKGLFLTFPILPGEEKEITVEYTQKIAPGFARYILTTTRTWQKPLEKAHFEIKVPRDWREVHISLSCHEVREEGNYRVFIADFDNFWPREDLKVSWEIKEEKTQ